MSYALEKLQLAISDLATGEGNIKERLRDISKYICVISDTDFPEPLRDEWNHIVFELTSKQSNVAGTKYDEGRFEATLYNMKKKKGSELAQNILTITEELDSYIKDGLWQ